MRKKTIMVLMTKVCLPILSDEECVDAFRVLFIMLKKSYFDKKCQM